MSTLIDRRRFQRLTCQCLAAAILGSLSVASLATTCHATWNATTAYVGGAGVSQRNINYKANWWTKGDDPASHHGEAGSGQPWQLEGSCDGKPDDGADPDNGNDKPVRLTRPIVGPYKDIVIGMDWNTYRVGTAVTGTRRDLFGPGGVSAEAFALPPVYTLAFATGECGSESWGGVPGEVVASANVRTLRTGGVGYIVSTGGAAGSFTCNSSHGMSTFMSRYDSPAMVGLDFDIEGGQTDAQLDGLIRAAVQAQTIHKDLPVTFTVATIAASDGSHASVNSLGDRIIRKVKASAIKPYVINLMVMDYGSASPAVCVVANGHCDMGRSAIQAVENVMATYAISVDHLEVTPMIGQNDVADEVFTTNDAAKVMDYVKSKGLRGMHIWSLDRDTPCGSAWASPTCHGLQGLKPLDYTRLLMDAVSPTAAPAEELR